MTGHADDGLVFGNRFPVDFRIGLFDELDLVGRQLAQEGAGDGHPALTAEFALPHTTQMQFFLHSRDADEQKPPLFFEIVLILLASFMR